MPRRPTKKERPMLDEIIAYIDRELEYTVTGKPHIFDKDHPAVWRFPAKENKDRRQKFASGQKIVYVLLEPGMACYPGGMLLPNPGQEKQDEESVIDYYRSFHVGLCTRMALAYREEHADDEDRTVQNHNHEPMTQDRAAHLTVHQFHSFMEALPEAHQEEPTDEDQEALTNSFRENFCEHDLRAMCKVFDAKCHEGETDPLECGAVIGDLIDKSVEFLAIVQEDPDDTSKKVN